MSSCISLGDVGVIMLCSLLVVFGDSSEFSVCGIVSSSEVKQVSKYSANTSDFSELVSFQRV